MIDDGPARHTTQMLPAADPVAIALIRIQQSLDTLGANVSTLMEEGKGINLRVATLEARMGAIEVRPAITSDRVRAIADGHPSVVDLEQAAQLAQERAAREALAAKLDELSASQAVQLTILARLDSVARNPRVKMLAAMLATAAIAWLSSHGGHP